MSGSTPAEALGDYQRFRARQAGETGDPPTPTSATAPPEDPVAAQRASEKHAISLLTPHGREIEAERIAAIAAAQPQTPAPPPREGLRQAHAQRAAAQHEAHRLQQALDRARAHLVEVSSTRDAAKRDLEAAAEASAARLIDELAISASGRVEIAGAGEKRLALAETEGTLEVANRAADRLGADLATAQTRLSAAEARVSSAVCAVLLVEAQRQADEILQAADSLDVKRANLDALGVTITAQQRRPGATRQPWPAAIHQALQPELRGAPRLPSRFAWPVGTALVRRWTEAAARLAQDPEATIEAEIT